MKHLFKNILVLAVMFGTFTSFGTESIEISSNSTFKITKGDLISVTDYSGKTIYSGRTKYTGDLKSLYNFTNSSWSGKFPFVEPRETAISLAAAFLCNQNSVPNSKVPAMTAVGNDVFDN